MKLTLVILMIVIYTFALASTGTGVSSLLTIDTLAPEIQLLSPQSGETWFMNQTYNIVWTATDLHLISQPIEILYSTNNGNSFTPITGYISNSGSLAWTVPPTPSEAAKVKVMARDSFGNTAYAMNSLSFTISYPYPAFPSELSLQIPFEGAIQVSWQAVTSDVNDQPFSPDGYRVLHSPNPYAPIEDWLLLGTTTDTSLLHYGALDSAAMRYYRVIAYKQNSHSGNSSQALPGVNPTSSEDAFRAVLAEQGGVE